MAASDDGDSKVMNNYNFRAPPEEAVVYNLFYIKFSLKIMHITTKIQSLFNQFSNLKPNSFYDAKRYYLKNQSFFMFSGRIKREQWNKMD